jgi:hypothetical protein
MSAVSMSSFQSQRKMQTQAGQYFLRAGALIEPTWRYLGPIYEVMPDENKDRVAGVKGWVLPR